MQAILYNDRSVLENFHSALTFKVLSHRSCNIFRALAKSVRGLAHSAVAARAGPAVCHFLTLALFAGCQSTGWHTFVEERMRT